MNRGTLKKLVLESYDDGELDPQKVNKIADLLSKSELKLYIKALKNWEKEHSIIIDMPRENVVYQEQIQTLFPDKKVVMQFDPTLLLGMKLQENDDIYEMSLKKTLNKITEHIEEQYD